MIPKPPVHVELLPDEPWAFREGDNAGGYWAQILEGGTVVATIFKPGLAEEIVAFLNGSSNNTK